MAYDKIIVIHSRLDRCLDYVQNDGKTDLGNAVDYICNPVKAGFQTAINCTLDNAFLQMQATKQRWDKYGGILGYHIVHSYAPLPARQIPKDLLFFTREKHRTACGSAPPEMGHTGSGRAQSETFPLPDSPFVQPLL